MRVPPGAACAGVSGPVRCPDQVLDLIFVAHARRDHRILSQRRTRGAQWPPVPGPEGMSTPTDPPRRVAVVAIHGVAYQRPHSSAEMIADVLVRTGRYRPFRG